METKTEVSAGGIVYRPYDSSYQVAIAARDEGKIWCLPKGIVEEGETVEEAALREVKEETGLERKVMTKLDRIDYWFYWKPTDTRYHKFVHFFLMQYLSGDISDHDFELDEIRWTSAGEALKLLSYKSERQMMEKAKELLEAKGRL